MIPLFIIGYKISVRCACKKIQLQKTDSYRQKKQPLFGL